MEAFVSYNNRMFHYIATNLHPWLQSGNQILFRDHSKIHEGGVSICTEFDAASKILAVLAMYGDTTDSLSMVLDEVALRIDSPPTHFLVKVRMAMEAGCSAQTPPLPVA